MKKIFGGRGSYADFFVGEGMGKFELAGMEQVTGYAPPGFGDGTGGEKVFVSQQRVADLFCVDADLVFTAGCGLDFEEA